MTKAEGDSARKLDQLLVELLPFVGQGDISKRVVRLPIYLLGQVHLFQVSESVIPVGEQDDFKYAIRRFQSFLSSLHSMGWSVATVISGTAHSVRLYLGYIASEPELKSKEIFENLLKGILPGTSARYCKGLTVERLLEGEMQYGGLVAGVPVLKLDEELQRFDLSSVIRSMYGQDYLLMFMSSPVVGDILAEQIRNLLDVRDRSHALARRTRGSNSGTSESRNESITHSRTETGLQSSVSRITPHVTAIAATASSKYPLVSAVVSNVGHFFSEVSKKSTKSHGMSVSHGETSTKTLGESLNHEEQNGMALELERLAERYIERLMTAVNVGAWETAITFVTKTLEGRKILSAALQGEIAKPSKDMFPTYSYFEDVDKEKPILPPTSDDVNPIFAKSLISTLTSEELAHISMPPIDQFPGYCVSKTPILGLSLPELDDDWSTLREKSEKVPIVGCVCANGEPLSGAEISVRSEDLARHVFVCGITGCGKTNSVKALLETCDVPFLVIESAKREYRQLIGSDKLGKTVLVYTVGDDKAVPISMNPFYVIEGVSLFAHIDFLKAIFNAAFSLPDPLPYVLEKSIHEAYKARQWCLDTGEFTGNKPKSPIYPTISDVKEQVEKYLKNSEYSEEIKRNIKGALVTRLDSLCVGSKGKLFNSQEPVNILDLLTRPTVLELEPLSDDDDKALFIGIFLAFLSEYRQLINDPSILFGFPSEEKSLEHLLVVEEAHRLLKNVAQDGANEHHGNPRGKAVEFFANVLAEMRSMGQGVIISEQIPTKLLPDVIKNTSTKIVHRLVAADDQTLVGASLGLKTGEEKYLATLKTGHALYFSEGMKRPTEIKMSNMSSNFRAGNETLRDQYKTLLPTD
ncbi:MAG: ATP-binding protein [Aestuariivita sp.]|nr:ATP-binding protein [Aestuariivita sp.]